MSINHVDYCNCAECIARFGLGPRPPRPAPDPSMLAAAELERLTRPSAPPRGLALEVNDPDLARLVAGNKAAADAIDEQHREALEAAARAQPDERELRELEEAEHHDKPKRHR